MPSYEDILEKVNHLNGSQKFLIKGELKELPSILWENENVEHIATGTYNNRNGILVATDKRVIFADKGMMSLKVEDFPYDKISSIQYSTGMILGSITFYASGNKAEIKNVEKAMARNFADYTRARISQKDSHSPASTEQANDPMVKLKKLGELRDSGIVSEEEFQEQKKKLLEML